MDCTKLTRQFIFTSLYFAIEETSDKAIEVSDGQLWCFITAIDCLFAFWIEYSLAYFYGMKAQRPAEIIHMSYITTSTLKEGKVAVLISVDNYSAYCWGVAVQKELSFESVQEHISGILEAVHEYHPRIKPQFVMAYGKEMLQKLEEKFPVAKFMFDPVLADEIAMPAAKLLIEQLFNKR